MLCQIPSGMVFARLFYDIRDLHIAESVVEPPVWRTVSADRKLCNIIEFLYVVRPMKLKKDSGATGLAYVTARHSDLHFVS